ncbi:MAG TPA: MoaD/ThiS family protein [Acidobacteriota bacterium]|nr:MoaD/ThiS family protein [Acidobacteriota bacterium]
MEITIHTILGIKKALGGKYTSIDLPDGSTVADVFSVMKERWGEKLTPQLFNQESGKINDHLRIMVNGQAIPYLNGMETGLKEGDEVLILPMISGG